MLKKFLPFLVSLAAFGGAHADEADARLAALPGAHADAVVVHPVAVAADGTAWMVLFSQNMLEIAMELAMPWIVRFIFAAGIVHSAPSRATSAHSMCRMLPGR